MGGMALELIKEKDGLRGLVPSQKNGIQDKVYGSYLDQINPRENKDVQIALASSPDVRFVEFLERIKLPRYKRMAVQTIAKGCNISLGEFQKWYNQASTQRSIALAQQASVKITEDMVEDAKSREDACERCDGTTWIPAQQGLPLSTPGYRPVEIEGQVQWIRDCPRCQRGKVRKPGDAHSRNLLLEMSGNIVRGKGGVSIIQNFGGASHTSAVADLDSMTMDLPDTIDAEFEEMGSTEE
jgi:hypothetical protein